MLLIVGRQETGNLEAQIRGSRFAWSIRVISVDALLRLMFIKEDVEDPLLVQRIHNMLIPREFTRLDAIADLLFSATEEVKQDEASVEVEEVVEAEKSERPKFTPVAFHEACVKRLQAKLGVSLIKRTARVTRRPTKRLPSCARSPRSTHPIQIRTTGSPSILINRSFSSSTAIHSWHSVVAAASASFWFPMTRLNRGWRAHGRPPLKIVRTGMSLSTAPRPLTLYACGKAGSPLT